MTDKYDLSSIDTLPAAPTSAPSKYDLGGIDAMPAASGFDKTASLFAASIGNPSEEAERRRLESDITRITGFREPVADIREATRRRQQLEADHVTRASPRTSLFLSAPENAAVAIQDAKTMAQIEAIIGGDPLRSLEIAAKRGAMSTGALGAKVGFDFPAVATDIIGESLRGVGVSDEYNVFKAMSASARRNAVATRSAIEYFTPEARNMVERAAASAGESAGMSLQLAPLAAATPQGAGMAAAFGLTTFAESYTKAREAGKGPLDSLKYAIPQGAFEGLFEMAPAAFLADAIKNAPGLKQFTLGLIGKEVPSELQTTLAQNLNDWVTFNPGKSVSDFIAEQPEALAETAIATVMGAGIQAGLIHGAQRVTGQFQVAQEERRLKQQAEVMQKLFEQAKNIKSDPVTFKSFMDGVTDNATVFVNADDLQQVLAQNGMSVDVLPTAAETLAAGPSVTGDVEIPVGELMTAFAGTPAQEQIVQHTRVRQDDLSQAQWEQMGDIGAFLKSQTKEVQERQKQNEQFQSELDEIEASFTGQLPGVPNIATAGYGSRDQQLVGRMVRHFYAVAADRMGVSPKQVADLWSVKFPGAEQAEAAPALTQGFDHGNAMLNVGLDVGATDRAQQVTPEFVKAEIEKLGVQVLSAKEVPGEYEYEGKMVQELTYVPQLSRPLTEAEVNQLAVATGQEAIGQYDNGVGNLWGPNAAAWGAFNPEFFKDQAGTKLSDAQKELAQSMSSRRPTTKKNPEDHLGEVPLVIDYNKIEEEKDVQNMALVAKYPGLRFKARKPAGRVEEFIQHVTDNLLWLHDQIPADIRQRSKLWYDGARAITDRWTAKYSLSDMQIAAVLAIYSPQKDWFMNVSLAERTLDIVKNHQDTAWSDEMSEVADDILADEKFALAREAIRGKKLSELTDKLEQAMWVRVFDEAHNNRGHRLATPEGGFVEFAKSIKGVDKKTGWPGFGTIIKALYVIEDGSAKMIDTAIGGEHKVRSFYNNIFHPTSNLGFVTIDTHAVAAGLLRPLSGNSVEVTHNFGGAGTATSAATGMSGTYAYYQEAYRRAAEARGLLPREMQSITWEAVRELYTMGFKHDKAKMAAVDKLWSEYEKGKRELDSVRSEILALAGGVEKPAWVGHDSGLSPEGWASSYTGELLGDSLPGRPAGVEPGAGERAAAGTAGSELAQAVRSAGAVAGPVVGIHYSQQPRTSLASSAFGSGMPGAERERLAAATDPRIKQRVAFYVNTGSGITPESGVGPHPHVATLRNLYDADADALKIWRNSKGDMNAAESAVLDAGFDGYLTRSFGRQGTVVMLGNRSADVQSVKREDVDTVAELPPSAEIPRMKQAAMAIMQNRALPNGQQSVESWKRDLERSDPETAALIAWDKIPAGDYYKDQIAGQLWQTTFKPVDTESAEFKAWFGDSKVVSEGGKPLVVYHGTPHDFSKFRLSKNGIFGRGVYLTTDTNDAEGFSYGGDENGNNIMPLYASIQHPYKMDFRDTWSDLYRWLIGEEPANTDKEYPSREQERRIHDALVAAGHDGIEVYGAGDRATSTFYIAFAPTQVKSAISNTGEFSDTNPSILFAEAAGPRRGSFNPLSFELRLTEHANRTTLIHELSHFFMAAYIEMAQQPNAPAELTEFVENLLGYLFKNVPGNGVRGLQMANTLGQKVGADGTAILLAPNGKRSKLTEQQWLQVRTPEFKAWFGDWEKHAANPVGSLWSDDSVSKIVDENGEPLVVYHGTQQGGFDVFRPEKGDKHRSPMLFATADAGTARSYSGRPSEIEVQSAATDVEARRVGKEWYAIDKGGDGSYAYNVYGDYVPIADAESYINKKEAEFFINTDLTAARQDSGDLQRGIYHLFLNIRDPNEVDFEGANWDGQQYDRYEVWDTENEENVYADDGSAVMSEDDAIALAEAQGDPDRYIARQAPDRGETTNSVAEDAKRYGNDGAIIRNVVDDGGKHGYGVDPSDVFVFFDSNQVKSATQNTGAFSRTDDSILRQGGDTAQPGPLPEGRTNIERWNAMTLDQQRPYWEHFAEQWEQYAMTGKAPTKALQAAFSAFAKWMKSVYQSFKNFLLQNPQAKPLDPEITQYFDRMLATEAELDAAREERGYKALFKAAADAGMSPSQFADYMALDELQKTEANELLLSRSLRDMKWLSNAKSKAIKEIQAEADELRALVRASVEEELADTPIRKAERWLRKGEMVQDGEQIKATAGFKLNAEIVKAMFPQGAVDSVDLAKLKQMMSSTGTQHPDDVAAIFGFRNGETLVRELLELQPFKDEASQLTDLRMLEEHGALATPEAIEKAADAAIHNAAHLKMVATEVWALNNRIGSVAALAKAAKEFAKNLIGNTTVKKLSPSSYANAATRAGKMASRAVAKKETDVAAKEKRVEMINAAAAKEAYAAEAEVRAMMNRLRKIAAYSDKHSSVTSREFSVVQAVRAILGEFEIGSKGEKAQTYVATVSEYDPMLGARLKEVIDTLTASPKPWAELTVDELRELHAEIGGLWTVAREIRTVELAGEKMTLDEARQQLLDKLSENRKAGKDGKAFSLTDAEIRSQDFMSFVARGVRPESWISMKDGNEQYGPWRRLIWNAIDRAQLGYNADKADKLKQLKALLETVAADMKDVQIDAPELGGTFGAGNVIGYSELLHAILHTGNESNKTKLLVGRGWGGVREDGTLDSTKWDSFMKRMWAEGKITKTHMDFVQGIWDLMESMKEGAQKAHRATTGRYFEEIQATEIVTPFGTYRGGYVPAIVDRRLVADADVRKALEESQTDVLQTFEKPAGGFTKSRVKNYNSKLELNIAALGRHIDQVMLFTHMSVPVRNVQRVLRGPALSKELSEQDRSALTKVIMPWLHGAATQTVTERGSMSYENLELLTKARSRAGAALMFANISNSVQQLTGFFPALLKTDSKELLFAAAKGWYKPRELAAHVSELSPYMKQRLADEVHAMAEEIDHILLNPTRFEKAQDWAIAHSYFLQMAVDSAMSPIIWQAKFNETIARGGSQQEAIDLADSAVRMTQGSNRAIDIAAMERGSPFYRLFMQFAGYFNTQINLVGEKITAAKTLPSVPAKYGRIGMVLWLGWLAPAIASALVVQLFRGGVEDDDDDGEWLDDWLTATLIGAPFKYAAAAVPVFGQTIVAAMNSFNDKPYDDRISMSPAVSIVEGGYRGGKALVGAFEDPTKAGRAIRDIGTFLSLFTGVPITPVTKAIGYATDVETGKVAPTGPVDYGRGIITGTASPESKR